MPLFSRFLSLIEMKAVLFTVAAAAGSAYAAQSAWAQCMMPMPSDPNVADALQVEGRIGAVTMPASQATPAPRTILTTPSASLGLLRKPHRLLRASLNR